MLGRECIVFITLKVAVRRRPVDFCRFLFVNLVLEAFLLGFHKIPAKKNTK
jgi:hypothetical protein